MADATNRIETLRRALQASSATNAAPAGLPTPGPVIRTGRTPAPMPTTPQAAGAVQTPGTQPPVTTVPPTPTLPAAAVPTTPGAVVPNATPGGAPVATAPEDELIPRGMIDFPSADISQVLTIYSELVGRTILRPANLPPASIILQTRTDLTRREAIQALDSLLALNGISMINVSDKFVKALPINLANAAGATISTNDPSQYPELGSYVTHLVQTKYLKPSEIAPTLQQFQSMATAVVAIDTSGLLVLRDNAENVKRMLEMVERVDISVPSEYLSEVIPIKFAQAEDIASALNSLSSGGGGTTVGTRATTPTTAGARPGQLGYGQPGQPTMPGQPTAGTPSSQSSFSERLRGIIQRASASGSLEILGETKIIADVRSNSLLIFAARQDMAMIKDIINKLDVVLAQVLIETIIMDVSLDSSWALGVSAGKSPETKGKLTSGGVYNNSGQLDTLSQFFSGALTNAFPSSSGLSYFGRYNNDLDVVLQAVSSDSKVNVIQKPRIQTSHATDASIFIGSTVPYVSSTYYGGGYAGGPSSSFQQLQVGINLQVTPFINAEGLVLMKIVQTIDEISGSTAITGVGDVPNTTKREFRAEIAVHDRETIILGGFIRNSESKTKSGVPLLKDIPLLGYLFRSTGDSKERKELIVLMRPTVLRTPELASAHVEVEKSRLPGVRQAERDIEELERKALEKEKRKSSKTPTYQETPRFLTPETTTPETSTP